MSLLFDESLQKINFLFKLAGLNFGRVIQNTAGDIIKYRSIYIFNFIWLNTDVVGEFLWIITGALEGKSFVELTYMAPCTAYCMVSNIKTLFLIINEANIRELFKSIQNMENLEIGNDEKEKEKIVNEEKNFLMVVISSLNFWNAATMISFWFSPFAVFALMGLQYKKTGEIELMLPFFIVYPFDPYDIKYWPFVYLHQMWSTSVAILGIGVTDCLFYTCCSCIHTQFRLLKLDIEAIIPEHGFEERELQDKFVSLVTRHLEIIRSVNLLEKIYTRSTLYNFVSSSIIICLCCFDIMAIDDVAFIITFVTSLTMCTLQIFLICLFGDMIMRSSSEISDAIYNSKWYVLNAQMERKLFLVQMRALKSCKLTASGYTDVNLRAFTKILSTAWSYFALLKTMYRASRV